GLAADQDAELGAGEALRPGQRGAEARVLAEEQVGRRALARRLAGDGEEAVAHAQARAADQLALGDADAVDERAVGAAQVLYDDPGRVAPLDDAVERGHEIVGEADVVVERAADLDREPRAERDLLARADDPERRRRPLPPHRTDRRVAFPGHRSSLPWDGVSIGGTRAGGAR